MVANKRIFTGTGDCGQPRCADKPGAFPKSVIAGKRKVFPERRLAEKTAGPPPETAYKTFLGSFCEFYDKM
ncbi:hypothetical protein B4135_1593 [Caldibacillus debilis]|uniref:Uncharacterized protein n=1 Tax=Caldibacillus debilis TaxID=301148 RepID=A0A150MBL8_9BACI|nr:hypothetical protein B4135_1593 [Caldibacillus debilis]